MQALIVRTADAELAGVTALQIDPEEATDGLPWLTAQLRRPAVRPVSVTLRIHNQAGIPIIEAQTEVAAGAATLTFCALKPLGIEAYAHAPEERRLEVARRVWSRRAYAILRCHPL
jgi:hypothetical protein